MISFDFSKFWTVVSPKNVAEKANSYSIGGVPLITYGFIGITAALLGTVHLLDKDSDDDDEKKETKGDTKTDTKDDKSEDGKE